MTVDEINARLVTIQDKLIDVQERQIKMLNEELAIMQGRVVNINQQNIQLERMLKKAFRELKIRGGKK